jgi:hypothetical protein
LRTGAVLRAPALDPVDRWLVEIEGDRAFVRRKVEEAESITPSIIPDVRKIVIVGGGAAGLACANELRHRGFGGEVTILSADPDAPCDRPNLSKDYLSGSAPEDWLWLRSEGIVFGLEHAREVLEEVNSFSGALDVIGCDRFNAG